MKNAFDGLISRLDMAENRISEFEDIPIDISREKEKWQITSRSEKHYS